MNNNNDVSFYINWKLRAQDRGKENKALKKRIKELIISRDGWKSKALESQIKFEDANKKLNSLEASFKKNFN
jgi:hypothetical protein